jgi:hypothetical protein
MSWRRRIMRKGMGWKWGSGLRLGNGNRGLILGVISNTYGNYYAYNEKQQ